MSVIIKNGKVDPRAYVEDHVSIQDKARLQVPFMLNPVQDVIWRELENGQWLIIVKARQMGCSTAILAYFFIQCITIPNTVAVVVSHEEFATQRLLDKVKFFEKSVPEGFKPKLQHKSAYEMTWPKINSTFYIGTARATVFGRGDTIHCCHLSEPAFYPGGRGEDLEVGISQAIPPGGLLIKESTPNGRVGGFYDSYQAAKVGENRFKPLFFPWWNDTSYRIEPGSPHAPEALRYMLVPTQAESDLMSANGLDMDQIRWRRVKLLELGELFRQEYPENDVDCWLVKGLAALPTESLLAMATRMRSPFYDIDGVRKWRAPTGGVRYLITVDAARGLTTSDPSVAVVLNTRERTHDATIKGRYPTDIMAQKALDLAVEYNNAVIAVEMDGHGDAVVKWLQRAGYPYIWKDEKGRIGWRTTGMGRYNRDYMLEELRTAIRTNTLQSWDGQFINEALDFQFIDGKAQAPDGGHDDMVMAMAIAVCLSHTTKFLPTQRPKGKVKRYAEGLV